MLSDETPEAFAERLNAATRSGKIADAYRVLQSIPAGQLEAVALRAGFAVIRVRKPRDLAAYVVRQVAEACRAKTDGHGLNSTREARPERA